MLGIGKEKQTTTYHLLFRNRKAKNDQPNYKKAYLQNAQSNAILNFARELFS